MKVLELLEEIEEIVDTASGFPLTGKIMIDADELLEIVKEIRTELPEEIQRRSGLRASREEFLQRPRMNTSRLYAMPEDRRRLS